MRSKGILVFLAVLMLAACVKPTSEPEPSSAGKVLDNAGETPVTRVGIVNGNQIWKFCDGSNLVYVGDAYSGNSIAVVADATECRG